MIKLTNEQNDKELVANLIGAITRSNFGAEDINTITPFALTYSTVTSAWEDFEPINGKDFYFGQITVTGVAAATVLGYYYTDGGFSGSCFVGAPSGGTVTVEDCLFQALGGSLTGHAYINFVGYKITLKSALLGAEAPTSPPDQQVPTP